MSFVKAVAERMGTIIVVDDMDKLGETILNYENIVAGMKKGLKTNNSRFNEELSKIVNEMFGEKSNE